MALFGLLHRPESAENLCDLLVCLDQSSGVVASSDSEPIEVDDAGTWCVRGAASANETAIYFPAVSDVECSCHPGGACVHTTSDQTGEGFVITVMQPAGLATDAGIPLFSAIASTRLTRAGLQAAKLVF